MLTLSDRTDARQHSASAEALPDPLDLDAMEDGDASDWPAWTDAASWEPGPSYAPEIPACQCLTPG